MISFPRQSDYDRRFAILQKYGCRHILISKENPASQEIVRSFLPNGSIVYEDNQFVLLSLASHAIRSDSPGFASFDRSDSSPIKE